MNIDDFLNEINRTSSFIPRTYKRKPPSRSPSQSPRKKLPDGASRTPVASPRTASRPGTPGRSPRQATGSPAKRVPEESRVDIRFGVSLRQTEAELEPDALNLLREMGTGKSNDNDVQLIDKLLRQHSTDVVVVDDQVPGTSSRALTSGSGQSYIPKVKRPRRAIDFDEDGVDIMQEVANIEAVYRRNRHHNGSSLFHEEEVPRFNYRRMNSDRARKAAEQDVLLVNEVPRFSSKKDNSVASRGTEEDVLIYDEVPRFSSGNDNRNTASRATEEDVLIYTDVVEMNGVNVTPATPRVTKKPYPRTSVNAAANEMEEEIPEIVIRHRKVLRLVPTVPHIPITCEDGSRLYLRLRPDDDKIRINSNKDVTIEEELRPVRRGLLGRNFEEIKKEAENLKDNMNNMLNELMLDIDNKENNNNSKQEQILWVDKYRPKGYLDLLSEETNNRALLHWLKLWDLAVFGTDYLKKVRERKEKYAKLEAKEREKMDKYKRIIVEDEEYDELGRPKQKVVLLHGPPGLGKTTAAHVICRHAGYNVIELNASDDRSVDAFKKMLDATTQSRSEMFKDGRPNCLVIDEIDGAPLPTISVLVDLILGKATESGKNKKKKVLRRPVICICNELYSPSLKNLRKLALLIPYHPITLTTLVRRLEDISLQEDLPLDVTTMYSLAEKTDCDIRSCLSCMQFLKGKGKAMNPDSRKKMLDQLQVHNKRKGIFDVWRDIFQIPETTRTSYYGKHETDPTRSDARFENVLRVTQNYGDYVKVMEGVFENYLKSSFRDSYFESIIEGLDWMAWFEQLRGFISYKQNYTLYPLLPYFFVASHFLFSGRNRIKIDYPSNDSNMKASRFVNTFKAQIGDMNANIGKFVDVANLTMDIFPALIPIVQPTAIRPVPSQLWSPKERAQIKDIVDLMIAYNLTYIQQRGVDGNYSFIMEPNVEELATFQFNKEQARTTKRQFPYSVKQVIAREIETERLRRNDSIIGDMDVVQVSKRILPKPTDNSLTSKKNINEKQNSQTSSSSGGSQQLTIEKSSKPKPFNLCDYFGVKKIPKKVDPEKEVADGTATQKKDAFQSDIYYRYKSGFTNAVRKKLKLKDLV